MTRWWPEVPAPPADELPAHLRALVWAERSRAFGRRAVLSAKAAVGFALVSVALNVGRFLGLW